MDDPPIRFGTSGWRGIVGEEVTPTRVDAVVTAAARWLAARSPGREILVAHDRREGGERLAGIAIARLRALGLTPRSAARDMPTPVVTRALAGGRFAGAIVVTASHNPPRYNGVKVFDARGCSVGGEEAARIEELVGEPIESPTPRAERLAADFDPLDDYGYAWLAGLDVDAIQRAAPTVFYDAIHGSGAGILDVLLERAGAAVERARHERDAGFGGGSPDPTPERLAGLCEAVRAGAGLRLGIATDGDADRFTAVDETGHVLDATQSLAVLVDHLGRRGRLGAGVALSLAVGSLAERVAHHWGASVERGGMGFRSLSLALLGARASIAGDECGGFAQASFSADKDGLLASGLLLESVAIEGPLAASLARLEREFGAGVCGRSSVAAEPAASDALAKLTSEPPGRVDRARVRAVESADGLRLALDDGFLMLRRSGTEPLIRIYAEAAGPADLERRLAVGRQLLSGL